MRGSAIRGHYEPGAFPHGTIVLAPADTEVCTSSDREWRARNRGYLEESQVEEMRFLVLRLTRAVILTGALMLGGMLALSVLPALVLAQSNSDTPAAECGSGPNVV